jgi:hypothetical protein
MAHYAFLDETNTVVEVIVGIDETELIEGLDTETWYGNFKGLTCKRTSYNAASNGFRFNYAGIGYTYDETLDAFIPTNPNCGHEELILNTTTYRWECANEEHQTLAE